jgi:hypothetical protein
MALQYDADCIKPSERNAKRILKAVGGEEWFETTNEASPIQSETRFIDQDKRWLRPWSLFPVCTPPVLLNYTSVQIWLQASDGLSC